MLQQPFMKPILLNFYQQRLEHLTATINQLHDIVLMDEASHLLTDQDLLRYKVDRVNQLVREIMHHERQKLLLAALTRCAALTEEHNKQKQEKVLLITEQHLSEMNLLKVEHLWIQNRNEQLRIKVIEMERLAEDERRRTAERVEAEKQCGLRQRQRQLEEREEQRKQIAGKNKVIRELSLQHHSLEEEVSRLKDFFRESPPEGYNVRAEKMNNLKKEVKALTAQLTQMQNSFSIIKDCILKNILNDLRNIRKDLHSFGRYALQQIQRAKTDIEKSMVQGAKTQFKREDELSKRVNELDNELDYFIERHIGV